jgi:hypothetical protein
MTIEIHADRVTDRQGRALAVGRGRSGSMRRPTDPVTIAKAAKALLRSRPWRNPREVEGVFRLRLPEALEVLTVSALRALTKRPPSPGCHWCSAFVLTVATGELEPPRDPAHLELLGRPCGVCAQRHVIDAARRQAREEAHAAMVAAAALPPARYCRTCAGSHRWQPATLTTSTASPRAATGLIWTGPQPPAVAALIAAATRVARPRRRRIATSDYRLLAPRGR